MHVSMRHDYCWEPTVVQGYIPQNPNWGATVARALARLWPGAAARSSPWCIRYLSWLAEM